MIKSIKDINKFIKEVGGNFSSDEKIKLIQALEDFPVKINDRVLRLIKNSPEIYKQFIPIPMEAESLIRSKIHKPRLFPIKGIERAYTNRLIITPVYTCESFCRYCFLREGKLGGKALSNEEIDKATEYINKNEDLKYILITGGDPIINFSKLERIMLNLKENQHILSIRIGTRSILYNPNRFDQNFFNLVSEMRKSKKRIEIGAHMNHPNEIDREAMICLENLAENHVTVYTQTVLLKDINDNAKILRDLYEKIYSTGGEIYLLFHCDPVRGINHLRTKISKGLEIKSELADLTSGRLIPQYKVAKCEIGIDSKVLEIKSDSILIKTPYSIKNLEKNIPGFKPNKPLESVSDDGKLIITYFGEW